jgi:hypothetical protein
MKPLCKDCVHFKELVWCKSPSNGMSLINGEPVERFASINRLIYECGLDGKYFMAKEETSLKSGFSS